MHSYPRIQMQFTGQLPAPDALPMEEKNLALSTDKGGWVTIQLAWMFRRLEKSPTPTNQAGSPTTTV